MTGVLLAAALRYAVAGWPVFPVRPDASPCPQPDDCPCKWPLIPKRDGGNGFKDATTDPAQVRAWWGRWPDANIGIATGAPGPDVLDVDKHEDGDGFAAFGRLKRAGLLAGAMALVRTRSGGLHAYYRGTGQPCGSLTRAGHFIDFKAKGGYVLAPPGRIHGRPYELLDHRDAAGRLDWQAARALLVPPRPAPARQLPRGDGSALAAFVAKQREGNRNDGLFWAACRATESGCDPYALLGAAVAAGLGEAGAKATIASAVQRARA